MDKLLEVNAHRTFPPPSSPWIMRQRWHDLLFAHWPMPADTVRPLLPKPLGPFLDSFEGSAWVGVVPFWMSAVRLRWLPPIPGTSTFPEMNVRTYLTVGGKPGVYFFSLDAASFLAVVGARLGFGLKYFHAKMSVAGSETKRIAYSSRRLQRPKPAEFVGSYGPNSDDSYQPQPGCFEYFATERYCLYTEASAGGILRGDIHHPHWELQTAWVEIQTNTVAQSLGIHLPAQQPRLHFARLQEVLIWAPEIATGP